MTRPTAALRSRLEEPDGGYVAVFVALCLPLLIGMCALAIDVAMWQFRGAQLQKAADSAALAGVVYLPSSPADAANEARRVACINMQPWNNNAASSCTLDAGVQVTAVPVTGKPTQLQVTISAPVSNAFGAIFGKTDSVVTRTVISDYSGPVPMGSPCNSYGNSPVLPWQVGNPSTCPSPDLWLQMAGPQSEKVQGDRYSTFRCGDETSVYLCDRDLGPNQEATQAGYFYVVRVRQAGPINIQVFDPAFVYTNQYCQSNMGGRGNGVNPYIPGPGRAARAATLYAVGSEANPGPYCTGDSYAGGSLQRPTVTSFVIRGLYDQGDPTATPVVASCGGSGVQGASRGGPGWSQFDGYDIDELRPALTQSSGAYNDDLAGSFRQWVNLCTNFNAAVGDYLIQIRTNVPLGSNPTDLASASTNGGGGQNMMALRATAANNNSLSVFGLGRMSMYLNSRSPSREFYLARAGSGVAGKTLRLQLFDAGDGRNGRLRLIPPADGNLGGSFSGCVGTVSARQGGAWVEVPDRAATSNCTTRTTQTAGANGPGGTYYNGKVLTFRVPIPKTYRCDDADPAGCWIKISYDFDQPHDVTTWSASIEGDPVRIVK